MNIVWMSWKDLSHPYAGGAETVTAALLKRLAADGHSVTLLTSQPGNLDHIEKRDGYRIIRMGGQLGVYVKAWRYYRTKLKHTTDLVIDEVNTIPFLAKFYTGRPTILFYHMLCREIWFYQLPWAMGLIGWLIEPVYTRLLSTGKVITISDSTKNDLIKHGFKAANIDIISEGIELEPINSLSKADKFDDPTILSFGSVRPMKRTLDQVKAFEIAKKSIKDLRLIIAGDHSGTYGERVQEYIRMSPYAKSISLLGRVDHAQKAELMRRSHVLTVTSIKEGWGLVVTEANSQGTPAVVYDVDGLRDSVKHKRTGHVTGRSPFLLSKSIVRMLADIGKDESGRDYETIQRAAYDWSKTITFDRAYVDFKRSISAEQL